MASGGYALLDSVTGGMVVNSSINSALTIVAKTGNPLDGKTTGGVTLYTVAAPANYFVVTNIIIGLISASGVVAPPTLSFGSSASYNDYVGATALTGLTAQGHCLDLSDLSAGAIHAYYALGTAIGVNITVGANATSYQYGVAIIGFLLN